MTDDETVYADWSALRRVAVPSAAVLLVLVLGGFFFVRSVGSAPTLSSRPVDGRSDASTVSRQPADPRQSATLVLEDFLGRLERGRFAGLTFAFTETQAAQKQYEAVGDALGRFSLDVVAGPVTHLDAANATAPLDVGWTLDDGVEFRTEGKLDMVLVGTEWQVDWEPAILETSLDPGDVLVRERVTADRAPILGRDGFPLVDNRPVINVGVVPRQADDIGELSQALGRLLGADPDEIKATIAPAPSDDIIVVATRRAEDLAAVQGQLLGLPGVVLVDGTFPLAPNERFGRALLGRSAEVTREIIEESPELFIAGDIAGRSGLQREYNARLAGMPGFQIRIERRFPTTALTPEPAAPPTSVGGESTVSDGQGRSEGQGQHDPGAGPTDPDVIHLSAPVPGTPLNLTIDQRVQNAAENALGRTELTGALVAIEVSTGHILAVANGPGAAVNNFALTGRYPPGSIFKTVTAYAAMEKGVGLTDPVDCPLTLNVNGRDFTNAEGEVLGTVPMRRAYVLSCNTAFINLSTVLDRSDLSRVAARFGVGAPYSLGTASYSGSVPNPGGPVEKAAASFGQGQVLISPLSAAVMAATAAGGTYRPPTLALEPEAPSVSDVPLDPTLAGNLQQIMRAVVTNGTGRALAGVAGGPVSGKTGTAEFGDQTPPQAHAWFIGFQGDLAFSVFVEAGEFGGVTAAPIAADFLQRLAG